MSKEMDEMREKIVGIIQQGHIAEDEGGTHYPHEEADLILSLSTDTCKIVRVAKNDLLRLFNDDPLMGYRFMSYMITVVGYRFHQFQAYVAKNLGEDLISGW